LAELAAADEAAQSSLRRQRFVPPRGSFCPLFPGGSQVARLASPLAPLRAF
jgi:hypothetical protein